MDLPAPDTTLDELLALEHRGWQALCTGTAAAFYDEVMTPDAVMVDADGGVYDRATIVAVFVDAPPWARYLIDEPRVVPVGPDVAALVYRGSGWRDAEGEPFVATMTSTYARRAGRWALALYQQVRLAG